MPRPWDGSTSRTSTGEQRYSGQEAYNQSKHADVMFTYELVRRLAGTGVTATALHPGVVRTGFAAEDPSPFMRFLTLLIRPFMKTPERGAAKAICLAASADVGGLTDTNFAKRSSKASHDTVAAGG